MSRELTEKQAKFLDCLFDEAEGDLRKAMDLAGYAPSLSVNSIAVALHDEIVDRAKKFIAANAPLAAVKLVGVVNNPVGLANMTLLSAVRELLDRAGIIKTEKISLEGNLQGGLFILPAKQE